MALLEEPNSCSLCEKPVNGSSNGVPLYFCQTCFNEWKEDILADEPWVREMVRWERIRRKRRNRMLHSGTLPVIVSTFDVALLGEMAA